MRSSRGAGGAVTVEKLPSERGAAQPVAGADQAIEYPFEVVLAYAALQVEFGDTAPAARRTSFVNTLLPEVLSSRQEMMPEGLTQNLRVRCSKGEE